MRNRPLLKTVSLMTKIPPYIFYGAIALVSAAVWVALGKFARLPNRVDTGTVSMFLGLYFVLVVAVSTFYESNRKKPK